LNQKTKLLALSVIAALIVSGAVVAVLISGKYVSGGSTSSLNCTTLSKVTDVGGNVSSNPSNSNATFLIVDADTGSPFEGMNGSAYHLGTPWPVINVKQNQTVTIRIFNCASSEPHGFAIAHYFNSGVTLPTGQSYTLNFVADQKGTFVMYCNTFCAIHPYMQDGEIIVS